MVSRGVQRHIGDIPRLEVLNVLARRGRGCKRREIVHPEVKHDLRTHALPHHGDQAT